jgi:hypothetical protein
MNKPVRYPIAKLLKEKEFDVPVNSYYSGDRFCLNYSIINQYSQEYIEDKGDCLIIPYTSGEGSLYLETINFNSWGGDDYSAPTIADVVMWLYEKHGIWIGVFSTDDVSMFSYKISSKQGHNYSPNYKSPTEAYEAAIEYTLNSLI